MFIKNNKGASILEAMIASALLSIAVLAFNKLHVVNFSLILNSTQQVKMATIISDFSEQIRLNTNNLNETDKEDLINLYLNANYNLTKEDCGEEPLYVKNCLSSEDKIIETCNQESMIKLEIFSSMCGIYSSTENLKLDVNYCSGSTTHICIQSSIDGLTRTQNECKNNTNKCLIVEVSP